MQSLHGYRAALLSFTPGTQPQPRYEADGLLVVGTGEDGIARVQAAGPWQALAPRYPGLPVTHWAQRLIAPGFIDLHLHFPQLQVIGSPADGLLPWLERYTFPEEQRFSDPDYAAAQATLFLDEMLRHGVTSALAFATSHPASVDALFAEARLRRLRLITGLCLMDRHAPAALLNRPGPGGHPGSTEQSLLDSEALIRRWHGQDRLGYAITPRFAPTSSEAQLRGAGELARAWPDVWIQSHVAENRDEIRWARELFPASRSYLSTYADFGLMRPRAVYAHCIHLDADDRDLMRQTGAAAAICPTSNLFLGSGFFDYPAADAAGFGYGLASDVGGGTSLSPFHTMLGAYCVAREGQTKSGCSLSPVHLWWQHTAGAARALGLD
ncbi:MAG: guanine deaminase, partial [Rhodoferax sp.]|nr:guanine deaminase [Rhodoferax sp.]